MEFLSLIAQSAPPVELSLPKFRAALVGAFAGATLSFRADLVAHQHRLDRTRGFDWGTAALNAGAGALTFGLIALGFLATA